MRQCLTRAHRHTRQLRCAGSGGRDEGALLTNLK